MSREVWVVASITLPFLAIWAGHWFPWRKLLGRDLRRPEAYAYGVICVVGMPLIIMALNGDWFPALLITASTLGAGIATLLAYGVDAWAEMRHRAKDLEDTLHAQEGSKH